MRDLDQMQKPLPLIRNIAKHSETPDELFKGIETVRAILDEALAAIAEGKAV